MTDVQTRPPRADKVEKVEAMTTRLQDSGGVILTEYRGLSVSALRVLRRTLREVGADYAVVKCTLAKIAAEQAGMADMTGMLSGPTALVYCGEDIGAAAKALRKFADGNEALVVKGGFLEGVAIDEAGAKALADLPSREELLSSVAGLFQASTQQMASLLQAPLQEVVGLAQALIEKQDEAA